MTSEKWQVQKAEESARSYFDMAHLDQVQSGLLQVIRALYLLAVKAVISFETLLELPLTTVLIVAA
jgi:hypothetical protein